MFGPPKYKFLAPPLTTSKAINKEKLIKIQKFNQISKEYEKEINFFP